MFYTTCPVRDSFKYSNTTCNSITLFAGYLKGFTQSFRDAILQQSRVNR